MCCRRCRCPGRRWRGSMAILDMLDADRLSLASSCSIVPRPSRRRGSRLKSYFVQVYPVDRSNGLETLPRGGAASATPLQLRHRIVAGSDGASVGRNGGDSDALFWDSEALSRRRNDTALVQPIIGQPSFPDPARTCPAYWLNQTGPSPPKKFLAKMVYGLEGLQARPALASLLSRSLHTNPTPRQRSRTILSEHHVQSDPNPVENSRCRRPSLSCERLLRDVP